MFPKIIKRFFLSKREFKFIFFLNFYFFLAFTLGEIFFGFKSHINRIKKDKLKETQQYKLQDILRIHTFFFKNIISASCLIRSLVLKKLLNFYGHESYLHIGIRRNNKIFESHAWLYLKDGSSYEDNDELKTFKIIYKENIRNGRI
ncbi:MAG: hypothetical protein CMG64_07625 [Candidatus Marinimicrobia bacterium]|nr:hypothetical protein [Candidatus Neomarinimicrobiota bacterium]|tara:strand:+ start:1727 stop:2164 length:438 start_codon:yes stop_codon:yes gene_type:complete